MRVPAAFSRWEDLPQDYRTALEAGVGGAPIRVVARMDQASKLQVYDVWDMRPSQVKIADLSKRRARPVLIEQGVISMEEAGLAGERALRPPRVTVSIGPRRRDGG